MVSEARVLRLTTLIYEAGEDPRLWPMVLDEIGSALGAPIRGFTVEDAEHPKSNLSLTAGINPSYQGLYN